MPAMTSPEGELQPVRPLPARGLLRVRVRYCECDAMGVAHHASYAPWFEAARTEMLREGGVTYRQMEASGVFLVVTGLEIRYRRPGRYDDVLEVACRVTGGGRVRLEHEYEVRVAEREGADLEALRGAGDDLLATGRTTLVCVGADVRARPLPDWLVPPGP